MSELPLFVSLGVVLLVVFAVVLYRIAFIRGAMAEQAEVRRMLDMIPPDRRRSSSSLRLINDRRAHP